MLTLLVFLGVWTLGRCECARVEDVRLAGGRWAREGRVEVKVGGQWGTVCDQLWGDADAAVTCRSVGLTGGAATRGAFFGQGSGPVHLSDVACGGGESSLALCPCSDHTPGQCRHSRDAGVVCGTVAVAVAAYGPFPRSSLPTALSGVTATRGANLKNRGSRVTTGTTKHPAPLVLSAHTSRSQDVRKRQRSEKAGKSNDAKTAVKTPTTTATATTKTTTTTTTTTHHSLPTDVQADNRDIHRTTEHVVVVSADAEPDTTNVSAIADKAERRLASVNEGTDTNIRTEGTQQRRFFAERPSSVKLAEAARLASVNEGADTNIRTEGTQRRRFFTERPSSVKLAEAARLASVNEGADTNIRTEATQRRRVFTERAEAIGPSSVRLAEAARLASINEGTDTNIRTEGTQRRRVFTERAEAIGARSSVRLGEAARVASVNEGADTNIRTEGTQRRRVFTERDEAIGARSSVRLGEAAGPSYRALGLDRTKRGSSVKTGKTQGHPNPPTPPGRPRRQANGDNEGTGTTDPTLEAQGHPNPPTPPGRPRRQANGDNEGTGTTDPTLEAQGHSTNPATPPGRPRRQVNVDNEGAGTTDPTLEAQGPGAAAIWGMSAGAVLLTILLVGGCYYYKAYFRHRHSLRTDHKRSGVLESPSKSILKTVSSYGPHIDPAKLNKELADAKEPSSTADVSSSFAASSEVSTSHASSVASEPEHAEPVAQVIMECRL